MQITLEIPDSLARLFPADRPEAERLLLQDAAIGAYCRDAITRHELQVSLGIHTRDELDEFLKSLGVTHGDYSSRDLLDDLGALEEYRKEHPFKD
jgi:hypothetical protein